MSQQVCAIVVTFNRKALFTECLRGLLAQTRPPDKILIINNASTDGTAEMLAADYPQLEIVTLSENVGASGGFHAGLKAAYDRGYEWLWVMDDDVEPHADCLETMLRYRTISEFIHVRRHCKGTPFVWEGVWDLLSLEKKTFDHEVSFANGREWISVNYGCFEGALIHRNVVTKAGLPDTRFFLAGDDSMYGFVASLHTNVIYVNFMGIERKLTHQDADRKKIYFNFRNLFLRYECLKAQGVPVSPLAMWFGTFTRIAWHLIHRREIRSFTGIKSIWTGIRDGLAKRYGRPAWIGGPR